MLPALALPAPGAFSVCVTALQCFNLAAGLNEVDAPTGYSKFAPQLPPKPVSGRTGMLMIYTPALAVGALALAPGGVPIMNGREQLVAGLITFHFFKRCVEVLCVHSYSGQVSSFIAGGIGIYYGLISALIMWQQVRGPALCALLRSARVDTSVRHRTWLTTRAAPSRSRACRLHSTRLPVERWRSALAS